MALKFLNKKGWHTGSLRNIEIVWKAEQKHEAEQRKLEELKKQIEDEREKQEFRHLQEQAGLVPKQERLEFLYDSGLAVGRSSNTTEDYLLGKPIEETKTESEVAKVAAAPGALFVDEKPESANDKWRKLHTDPLLLIRQQEQAALARIRNNPIKMDMIKKSIEEKNPSKEKKRKHKDKKKKYKEEKKKTTKKQQQHSHDDSDGKEVERGRKEARNASPGYMSDREVENSGRRRHQRSETSLDKHDDLSERQHASCKRRHDSPESGNESPWRRRASPERRYGSPKRRYDSLKRRHDGRKRQRGSPERQHGSLERRRESLQRCGSPEGRHPSPRWRSDSPRKRHDTPERRHDSPKRRRHDSPESPQAERPHARVRENEEHPSAAAEVSEKYGRAVHQKTTTKQPGRKLTGEEKAARLKAMQEDAEVHEEQRWHRLKKASDADRLEEAKRSSGRNFLDQTARSFYGAAQGGSASVEESVRRRSHFIERSLGDGNINTFQRS